MTKNKDRIRRMKNLLQVVEDVWMECPDLRLGQLLDTAIKLKSIEADLFYIDNADLMLALMEYVGHERT